MTATPRPWTIKKIVNRTHPTADVWIDDENGNPVMITDPDKAALIVRAVNSHAAMIEALERWNSNSAGFDNAQLERRFDPYTIKSIHMTRTALKLAKGET